MIETWPIMMTSLKVSAVVICFNIAIIIISTFGARASSRARKLQYGEFTPTAQVSCIVMTILEIIFQLFRIIGSLVILGLIIAVLATA